MAPAPRPEETSSNISRASTIPAACIRPWATSAQLSLSVWRPNPVHFFGGKIKALEPTQAYVVPGKLWWALNPKTAGRRCLAPLPQMPDLEDPGMTAAEGDKSKAALVLDEIDKADPDVP